jgi:hypothetical protein
VNPNSPDAVAAPALSTTAQSVLNAAARAGLFPLVGDVVADEVEVAFLPSADADPEREAAWILVLPMTGHRSALLIGPPPAAGDDAAIYVGWAQILQHPPHRI